MVRLINIWEVNTIFIISVPLLICFTINYDIKKNLNMFLSFPDQAFKNNLRFKTGKFKDFQAR